MWGKSGRICAAMQSLHNWLHTRNSVTHFRAFRTSAIVQQEQTVVIPTCIHLVPHKHTQEQSECFLQSHIHPSKMVIPLWSSTHTVQSLFLFHW